MTDLLRVTDDADRATLCQAIETLRARQRRLPVHFEDARQDLADEIDWLVDRVREMDRA